MRSENSSHMLCPICGGTLILLNIDHPGYQKPLTFSIYECKYCDSQIAYPLSAIISIYDLIYKNGDKIPGYSRYFRIMDSIKKQRRPSDFLAKFEDMYWFVVNYLLENDSERKWKILEVGSGLGYLTYALRRAGWNVKGIDIAADAVRSAESKFGPYYIHGDVIQYSQENPARYDAIVMLEVIEHLTDIFSMMDAIFNLLKPNGVALVTTPNKSYFPPGAYWKTGNPPVHFWWLSEKSMVYIAMRTGFYVTFCDFTRFNLKDFSSASTSRIPKDTSSPARGPMFDENGGILRFDPYVENPSAKASRKRDVIKSLKRSIRLLMQFVLPKVIYETVNLQRKSRPFGDKLWRSKSLGAVFHKLARGNDSGGEVTGMGNVLTGKKSSK